MAFYPAVRVNGLMNFPSSSEKEIASFAAGQGGAEESFPEKDSEKRCPRRPLATPGGKGISSSLLPLFPLFPLFPLLPLLLLLLLQGVVVSKTWEERIWPSWFSDPAPAPPLPL